MAPRGRHRRRRIAGLSAAYDLARAGVPHTLIEKQPRLGGVIETRTLGRLRPRMRPGQFHLAKAGSAALIKELGLEGEVIGSNDHQRITYILRHGQLVRLPEGMMMFVPTRVMPMVKSPLLGWGTKIRMGAGAASRGPETHPGSQRGGIRDRSLWAGNAGLSGRAAALRRLWRRSGAS